MIDIRPFSGIGHADHGWLDARHHFSFAGYHDPGRMGWGAIRVWNDDTIAAKSGFPPHSHADMEIITYVRSGAITHKDSLGNTGRTRAGNVQVMSAGTGITHAEYNLEDEATTLFQIWIMPDAKGHGPSWGQREFPQADRSDRWTVVASGNPASSNELKINADAQVLAARLPAGETLHHKTSPERYIYLVPLGGSIRINGSEASDRDGVAITGEHEIEITSLVDVDLVMVNSG